MKASHRVIARLLCLSSVLLAAGCIPAPDSTPSPDPSPVVQAPAPTPSPAPATTPSVAFENWIDAPRTPGDWSYSSSQLSSGRYSSAEYAAPDGSKLFTVMCSPGGSVVLQRWVASAGQPALTIRTETGDRTLAAPRDPEGRQMVAAVLRPRDPLLDAMAVTRGRFAVETEGKPTLYLPPWAEVTRVIEDCR